MKLSIIVCSRTAVLPPALKSNIESTINSSSASDFDYEFVVVDNSQNKYTIAQAYNRGVDQSTGDILCFMHDDIEYHTNDWGKLVANLFEDPQVMACCVVASPYTRRSAAYHGSTYQYYIDGEDCLNGGLEQNGKPVVVFDGMWFCIRKSCFSKIRFDEGFPGFHGYDLDIAMQLFSHGMKTIFTSDLLVKHCYNYAIRGRAYIKEGVFVENLFRYYRKWHHLFPAVADPDALPTPDGVYEMELEALYTSLRLIVLGKRFHLLPQHFRMAVDVLHKPLFVAIPEIMIHHRRLLRWKREAKKPCEIP